MYLKLILEQLFTCKVKKSLTQMHLSTNQQSSTNDNHQQPSDESFNHTNCTIPSDPEDESWQSEPESEKRIGAKPTDRAWEMLDPQEQKEIAEWVMVEYQLVCFDFYKRNDL